MQQHGNEILIGYHTAMGSNEVPCINTNLNLVHCPLQKCQILNGFLWLLYHLGLQGDVVYSGFFPSLAGHITSSIISFSFCSIKISL